MSLNKGKIGSIVTITKGKKHSEIKDTSATRYIQIEDINGGCIQKFTREKGVQVTNKDVIIAWDGANAGKVGTNLTGVIGSTLARLRPTDSNVDNNYLYRYLQFKEAEIKSKRTGATIPHVNGVELKNMQLPLPSLSTQQKVAAILNKADALRKKDQQLIAKYDELLQSIFYKMFGDPVKNEIKWEVKKLGDCSTLIQIGPFGTQLHAEDYVENGIPLVNPMHIVNGKIVPQNNFTVPSSKYIELKNYYLYEGDIIMGRRGEMGRCAVVTKRENGWLCGTGSLFIRPKEDCNSQFLQFVLSSKSIKTYLENLSQGVTMSNLNQKIVTNVPIICPPITLQDTFSKISQNIENQKLKAKQQLQHSNYLFKKLLQKAFTGELTQ